MEYLDSMDICEFNIVPAICLAVETMEIMDHVYFVHPSTDISIDISVDISIDISVDISVECRPICRSIYRSICRPIYRPICRPIYRPRCRPSVGRHLDRLSVDISIDI